MVKTLLKSALIAGVLTMVLCAVATADDVWASWWGDRVSNVTYWWDDWANRTGDDPYGPYTVLPDHVRPPGSIGDALVTVRPPGRSLIEGPIPGYGDKTWFWDLGPTGGMNVDVGSSLQGMLVWVQVTYFDMGVFPPDGNHNAPTVDVGGAHQIAMGPGQYDVYAPVWIDTEPGTQWLTYASLWRLEPGASFTGINITTGLHGAIIDQVVVDTHVIPEPGAVMLGVLGNCALLVLRRYRRK